MTKTHTTTTKMTMMVAAMGAALTAFAGCAADQGVDAPAAEDDALEAQASITNNGFTATSEIPSTPRINNVPSYGDLWSRATFTGPSNRRMGVCMLQMTGTPCTTTAQCGSSPSSLPSGGFRYCTNPDNSGQKYCAFRPGSPTAFCAGTPAQGGVVVAPGTYTTPRRTVSPGVDYVSYACFEGCATSDPAVSSAGQKICSSPYNGYVGYQWADTCYDVGCDGMLDWCTGPDGTFPYEF